MLKVFRGGPESMPVKSIEQIGHALGSNASVALCFTVDSRIDAHNRRSQFWRQLQRLFASYDLPDYIVTHFLVSREYCRGRRGVWVTIHRKSLFLSPH